MRESMIEAYLVDRVAAAGGMAEKFKSPQRKNVPDRIVSWNGEVHFVELKATGEGPNDGQVRDHRRRRAQRHMVFVLDSKEAVDWYVNHGRNLGWPQYVGLHDSAYPSATWIRGNGVLAP